MIPFIRSASAEEVAKIAEGADLTSTSAVWAWPSDKADPDLAVIRQCMEIDPVVFASTTGNQRKTLMFWSLCNILKASGTREVYFNIDADDPDYCAIIEKMGAEKVSPKPQHRYKLGL